MFFAMISWEKVCEDPIVGLNLLMIICALVIIIPLLEGIRSLFHAMYEYLLAPREYPWIRGLGRRMWLDKNKKEKPAWEK